MRIFKVFKMNRPQRGNKVIWRFQKMHQTKNKKRNPIRNKRYPKTKRGKVKKFLKAINKRINKKILKKTINLKWKIKIKSVLLLTLKRRKRLRNKIKISKRMRMRMRRMEKRKEVKKSKIFRRIIK